LTAAGTWRDEGDVSVFESDFRGAFTRANLCASIRSSFSVTAMSMTAARSTLAPNDRRSAWSRSSRSRSSALVVNWIL
jgi:hypothetical protein